MGRHDLEDDLMFEITYSDGATVWMKVGAWEDLPSDQVQIVEYIQMDGARVRLAGLDSYYLAGLLWGGVYEPARRQPVPGWQYEIPPGRPARLVGPIGIIPADASVKHGSLIPDALAAELQLFAGASAEA